MRILVIAVIGAAISMIYGELSGLAFTAIAYLACCAITGRL